MEKPLKERRAILKSILKPVDHILEISDSFEEAASTDDIMERLDMALDKKLEGLVIKNMESTYQPNERHGGWIKLKPEYVEGMSDTVDLVILGGFYGQGKRRSGKLAQFLLGVSEKPVDGSTEPKKFFTFCKVGTGLTGAELDKVLEQLNPHWVRYNKDAEYEWMYKWKPAKDDMPDAIIDHPKNSIVLEVLAGGIMRNVKFNAGCTLRFPRTKSIRWTKAWYDCNTINGRLFIWLFGIEIFFRCHGTSSQE
jgi:DNA ligase-4